MCSEDEINPTTHYNAADGLPSLDSQVKGEENHFIDIYPQIILEETLHVLEYLPSELEKYNFYASKVICRKKSKVYFSLLDYRIVHSKL